MNRRRFFGLLAAAPAALAAIARGGWSSYDFRFVAIPPPYKRPYVIFRQYLTKDEVRKMYPGSTTSFYR